MTWHLQERELSVDELVDNLQDAEQRAYLAEEFSLAALTLLAETNERLRFTEALLADVLRENKR